MTEQNYIAIFGLGLTFFTFLAGFLYNHVKNRETTNRATYQTLELASIDLFRYESEHLDKVDLLWQNEVPISPEHKRWLRNYLFQVLNLFEMAYRFDQSGILEDGIYDSWEEWVREVCRSGFFQAEWGEMQKHYIPEFRRMISQNLNAGQGS